MYMYRYYALGIMSSIMYTGCYYVIDNDIILCTVEGKRHDSGMLADSGLLQELEPYAFSPTGEPMCIYGDPAYPLRVHLHASSI